MYTLRDLVNSRNPLIAAIFGVETIRGEYDPCDNLRTLQRVEQCIYGPGGLEAYEATRPPERDRLMRRSFAQYLCQRALYRQRWVAWVHSLLGGIVVAPLAFWFLLRYMSSHGRREIDGDVDAVIFAHYERFRPVFASHYPFHSSVLLYRWRGDLSVTDLAFLIKAFAACPGALLYPAFVVSVIRWVADYGHVARLYRPKCVVNLFEGSAAASVATAYLREQGIRHHNHMHGERFYYAGHSFCEFDVFHVWGEYFRDLFIRLRCPAGQFVVTGNAYHQRLFRTVRRVPADPRARRLLIVHNQVLTVGSPYYHNLMRVLKTVDETWEVRVRLHYNEPAHGEAFLRSLQAEPELSQRGLRLDRERGPDSPFESSLTWSTIVVGAYTTVLLEAWIAGRKVIHVGGKTPGSVVMERYAGSANVLYADETANIAAFLSSPVRIDSKEDLLVHAVTQQCEYLRA